MQTHLITLCWLLHGEARAEAPQQSRALVTPQGRACAAQACAERSAAAGSYWALPAWEDGPQVKVDVRDRDAWRGDLLSVHLAIDPADMLLQVERTTTVAVGDGTITWYPGYFVQPGTSTGCDQGLCPATAPPSSAVRHVVEPGALKTIPDDAHFIVGDNTQVRSADGQLIATVTTGVGQQQELCINIWSPDADTRPTFAAVLERADGQARVRIYGQRSEVVGWVPASALIEDRPSDPERAITRRFLANMPGGCVDHTRPRADHSLPPDAPSAILLRQGALLYDTPSTGTPVGRVLREEVVAVRGRAGDWASIDVRTPWGALRVWVQPQE